MRYKLLLLFFSPLLLFSQENGILKEYDRSSLAVMMIFHPEDEFAHNICEAFFTMPFPDKYDNHNQSIRIIDYNTFCNVKDKNETYAFRSSDTTIMKNNQLFYDTLCQNSLMLESAHHKEAYCNHIRRIIKKNTNLPDSSINHLPYDELQKLISSFSKKRQDKIQKGIEMIPIGLHKAKYGKVLSQKQIQSNARALETVLNENGYGKQLVAKWFNLDGTSVSDATFDMQLVQERGNYNATQLDIALASQTARGTALLADMGENLIKNTFVLVNDISYVTSEEKAQAAKLGVGIGATILAVGGLLAGVDITDSAQDLVNITSSIADSFTGFNVKTHSYLFQLQWDDETAAIFYENYYTEVPDSAKIISFLNDNNTFKVKYVEHEYEFDNKAVMKGAYDRQELIRTLCTRSMDKNIAALQLKYEDFKVKTPIRDIVYDEKGRAKIYCAEVGMKEGITSKSSFQVIQRVFDEETRQTSYKYIATLKPIEGAIWDNRYNAVTEKAKGSELSYTSFRKISGGEILPGMLIIEGKYKKAK